MLFHILRNILIGSTCFLASCATSADRKWIPEITPDITLPSGQPAHILVLKEEAAVCAQWHDLKKCHEVWVGLPTNFPRIGEDEVEYLRRYKGVTERVRLSQEVFCAVLSRKHPLDSDDCDQVWQWFKKQKSREMI